MEDIKKYHQYIDEITYLSMIITQKRKILQENLILSRNLFKKQYPYVYMVQIKTNKKLVKNRYVYFHPKFYGYFTTFELATQVVNSTKLNYNQVFEIIKQENHLSLENFINIDKSWYNNTNNTVYVPELLMDY